MYLAIYAFVKGDTKRPPVNFAIVPTSFVHLRGQISKGAGFGGERFAGAKIRRHVLHGQPGIDSRDGGHTKSAK